MNEFWEYIKYFKLNEFDSPDILNSGRDMDKDLILMLDLMRMFRGTPIIINSGYRSPSRNIFVGGKDDSSHLYGLAGDIEANSDKDKFELVYLAIRVGFVRIGVYPFWIHLDIDKSKKQGVLWYGKK